MAEAKERLADLQGAEHEGHARAGQAHDHRQDRDQPQLPEKALEHGFQPFLQGGLPRWPPDGGSPTRGPGAWEGLGCKAPARFSPIVLAHGGLWGCQPWKTAATGTGLACTPVCPAYRPALLTGLPAYQPALLTLFDVRRRGRRAGWGVLIRLRAAPVE